MDYKDFGLKIRELRMQKGLSQKYLGEKCNLSQQAINRLEHGLRSVDIELLAKLSDVLECDTDDLVGWNKDKAVKENLKNSHIAAELVARTIKKELDGKILQVTLSTEEYTPQELLDILEYAEFVKSRRKKEANDQPAQK